MEIFLGIMVFTWNVPSNFLSIKNFCLEMGERFFFELEHFILLDTRI